MDEQPVPPESKVSIHELDSVSVSSVYDLRIFEEGFSVGQFEVLHVLISMGRPGQWPFIPRLYRH